jgi:hypothetical protein
MGLVGCIGCNSPSSFLDERVGCYCTSTRYDWIIKRFVNVASKDVASLHFFAKTLILIALIVATFLNRSVVSLKEFVAITNNGALECNSFARLVASSFTVDCQDLLLL